MHAQHDFVVEGRLPRHAEALVQDLALRPLFDAMARGDAGVAAVARRALLEPLTDPAAIGYRQAVLADCLANPSVTRALHALAVAAIERAELFSWGFMPRRPESIVRFSHDVLLEYLQAFKELRRIAERSAEGFTSAGFRAFFELIRQELDDPYLRDVERQLRALRFKGGIRVGVRLGPANKGRDHVVQRASTRDRLAATKAAGLWSRLRGGPDPVLTYQLPPRDENAVKALSLVRDRALERVAEVVARATDHVIGFFHALRAETAFYVGCLNLHESLTALASPTCVPEPLSTDAAAWSADGLYDPCLALQAGTSVVANELRADAAGLVLVTGANQGGKTTFLRSVGVAQLMMQCGLFAPARSFRASAAMGLFTHFKREEDASMTSGKLDEELSRMSAIVDDLTAGSLLLLNESFAATNEREGSEIAQQIIDAVTETGVRVVFVTHLNDFARARFERDETGTLCLRAERGPDGTRTFRLHEAVPERTSHGIDLFRTIFEHDGPQRPPVPSVPGNRRRDGAR